jgi:hypothetical protein
MSALLRCQNDLTNWSCKSDMLRAPSKHVQIPARFIYKGAPAKRLGSGPGLQSGKHIFVKTHEIYLSDVEKITKLFRYTITNALTTCISPTGSLSNNQTLLSNRETHQESHRTLVEGSTEHSIRLKKFS